MAPYKLMQQLVSGLRYSLLTSYLHCLSVKDCCCFPCIVTMRCAGARRSVAGPLVSRLSDDLEKVHAGVIRSDIRESHVGKDIALNTYWITNHVWPPTLLHEACALVHLAGKHRPGYPVQFHRTHTTRALWRKDILISPVSLHGASLNISSIWRWSASVVT